MLFLSLLHEQLQFKIVIEHGHNIRNLTKSVIQHKFFQLPVFLMEGIDCLNQIIQTLSTVFAIHEKVIAILLQLISSLRVRLSHSSYSIIYLSILFSFYPGAETFHGQGDQAWNCGHYHRSQPSFYFVLTGFLLLDLRDFFADLEGHECLWFAFNSDTAAYKSSTKSVLRLLRRSFS